MFSPVKITPYDPGTIAVFLVVFSSPAALSGDCVGVGIQKNPCLIKNKPARGIVRAVQPIGILKLLDVQTKDNHGIDKTDPVSIRKRQDSKRLLCLPVEEKQLAGRRLLGLDRKINSPRNYGCTRGEEKSGAHLKAADHIQWL